jgi:hypothetical protein
MEAFYHLSLPQFPVNRLRVAELTISYVARLCRSSSVRSGHTDYSGTLCMCPKGHKSRSSQNPRSTQIKYYARSSQAVELRPEMTGHPRYSWFRNDHHRSARDAARFRTGAKLPLHRRNITQDCCSGQCSGNDCPLPGAISLKARAPGPAAGYVQPSIACPKK